MRALAGVGPAAGVRNYRGWAWTSIGHPNVGASSMARAPKGS